MKFTFNSNTIRATFYVVSLSSLAVVSFSSNAEVYKWKDAQGVIQYSDKPPITKKLGNEKLKAILDAQALCSTTQKPKNATASKVYDAATQPDMASVYIPILGSTPKTTSISPLANTAVSAARFARTSATPTPTTSSPVSAANTGTTATAPVNTTTNWLNRTSLAKQTNSLDGVQVFNFPKTTVAAVTPVAPAPVSPAPVATAPVATAPAPVVTATAPVAKTTFATVAAAPVAAAPVAAAPVAAAPVAAAPVATTTPTAAPANTGYMPTPNLGLAPAPSVGYSDLRIQPITEQPVASPDDNGAFRVSCDFSHMLKDDPIVFPGQQGRSHLHTFFGNTGTNYASTSESIRTSGNSTCNGGIMNRSAYWVPSMIDTANGAPQRPRNALMYYKHGKVTPMPRGLRMIAGSATSSAPQAHEWFECNEDYNSRSPNLVSCGKGGLLSNAVFFPECWDGKNLDSPDHKSHMAYSEDYNNSCPATHPVKLTTLAVITYYPVTTDAGTSNWRLASDNYPTTSPAGYSSHADYMMGWDETIQTTWVDNIINKGLDGHAHLLGDGRTFF